METSGLRLKVVDVTLSASTSILADNDLVADTQIVLNAVFDTDKCGVIESAAILDGDDNTAIALDLYVLSDSGSMGTENAALGPTDAIAATILGVISFAAADFRDFANSKGAFKSNLGLVVKPKSGTRDIYVAAAILGAGTPTYTAAGLKVRLGIWS